MRRRTLLAALAGGPALPLAAHAQAPRRLVRIGTLSPGTRDAATITGTMIAMREGLRELGYIEGQNLVIEFRFADWQFDRMPALAAELVALRPDIIVTSSSPPAIALVRATRSIPIVGVVLGDPVADGLVASLAAPGGNVTGNTFIGPELVAKRFDLMKEAMPGLRRVGALWHPGAYGARTLEGFLHEADESAMRLGLALQREQARVPAEIGGAIARLATGGAQAIFVLPSGMLYSEHARVAAEALGHRLPCFGQSREFAEAGAVLSYGADIRALARAGMVYVDRILKGAKPGDLPVQQPTVFEMLVNQRTARSLGIELPPSILARADEVIE